MFAQIDASAPVNEVVETATTSTNVLIQSFHQATAQVIEFAPNVVAMLIVLVVGYVVARLCDKVISTLCEKVGLQTAAERGGLVTSMRQVGIDRTMPQIVGKITFWLAMSFFIMAGLNILGLPAVTDAMGQVVAYIPKLITATVMVVVGLMLAKFLHGVIATSADRVGITYATQLATGVYYVLAMMVFIAAFEQLDIQFGPLNQMLLIGFAGVAVAFGLSVGLGGRDVVAGILAGYYVRQRMVSGDHVTVAGFEGTVREVGPVATIIETEEEGLLHRHSIPNARMLNEAVR
ncbi:MAG: mechanosensitive ion channel [Planctomycetales bacterium]|nr:mechanosensitive ion channel [Planctomycetales bacterium]